MMECEQPFKDACAFPLLPPFSLCSNFLEYLCAHKFKAGGLAISDHFLEPVTKFSTLG